MNTQTPNTKHPNMYKLWIVLYLRLNCTCMTYCNCYVFKAFGINVELRAAGYTYQEILLENLFRSFFFFFFHLNFVFSSLFCVFAFCFPFAELVYTVVLVFFSFKFLSPTSCFVNELIASILCHPYTDSVWWAQNWRKKCMQNCTDDVLNAHSFVAME